MKNRNPKQNLSLSVEKTAKEKTKKPKLAQTLCASVGIYKCITETKAKNNKLYYTYWQETN